MIGVFVTFRYRDGIDAGAVTRIAEAAGERFRGMPGLRSKAFTVDEAGDEATNFYVWDARRQRMKRPPWLVSHSPKVSARAGVSAPMREASRASASARTTSSVASPVRS
jgi:hypothetical protein